jgi:hypothetical protein
LLLRIHARGGATSPQVDGERDFPAPARVKIPHETPCSHAQHTACAQRGSGIFHRRGKAPRLLWLAGALLACSAGPGGAVRDEPSLPGLPLLSAVPIEREAAEECFRTPVRKIAQSEAEWAAVLGCAGGCLPPPATTRDARHT